QPPHNSAVVVRHHKLSKHNPPEHSNGLSHENTQTIQHHSHHPKKAMQATKITQEIKDARVHYTVTNNNTPTNTTTTTMHAAAVMSRAQPPTTTNSDD